MWVNDDEFSLSWLRSTSVLGTPRNRANDIGSTVLIVNNKSRSATYNNGLIIILIIMIIVVVVLC